MTEPTTQADWDAELALVIAKARHGPGVDMGGAHNPRPSELIEARRYNEIFRAAVEAEAAGTPADALREHDERVRASERLHLALRDEGADIAAVNDWLASPDAERRLIEVLREIDERIVAADPSTAVELQNDEAEKGRADYARAILAAMVQPASEREKERGWHAGHGRQDAEQPAGEGQPEGSGE